MSVYCRSGKRGFATQAEALAELESTRAAAVVESLVGSRRRRERRVYRCSEWCGQWHLTSKARAA